MPEGVDLQKILNQILGETEKGIKELSSKTLQYLLNEVNEIKRINKEKGIQSAFEIIAILALKDIKDAKKEIYEIRNGLKDILKETYGDKEEEALPVFPPHLVDEFLRIYLKTQQNKWVSKLDAALKKLEKYCENSQCISKHKDIIDLHERKIYLSKVIYNYVCDLKYKYLAFRFEIIRLRKLRLDPSGKSWKEWNRNRAKIFQPPRYNVDLLSYNRIYKNTKKQKNVKDNTSN